MYTGDTCCKGSVLLALEYSAPLDVYAAAVKKILKHSSEYDLTWPGHHEYPVSKDIIRQFDNAAQMILRGEQKGEEEESVFGKSLVFAYKDIKINYPNKI